MVNVNKSFQEKLVNKENSPIQTNVVYCGDCTTTLHEFPDQSIDVVVTSPPYYQQRNYTGIGIGTESNVDGYMDSLHESFDQLLRVIKPTGHILYNIGDKIDKKKGTMLLPYRFALSVLEKHEELILNNLWSKVSLTIKITPET